MKIVTYKKRITLFVFSLAMLCCLPVSGKLTNSDNPFNNINKISSEESQEEESEDNELLPKPPTDFPEEYLEALSRSSIPLFSRKHTSYKMHPINAISKRTFKIIRKNSPKEVEFRKKDLYHYDYLGTCTAMALDFLGRYLREGAALKTPEERRKCVEAFVKYYEYTNETFISRQAAFNTITLAKKTNGLAAEEIKEKKIQAVANFHNITLHPATDTLLVADLNNPNSKTKDIINSLPDDVYLIRAMVPSNNHKKELWGHTLVLIKSQGFSVLYDNPLGALEITTNPGEHLKNMMDFKVRELIEFRLYSASSEDDDYPNLYMETEDEIEATTEALNG